MAQTKGPKHVLCLQSAALDLVQLSSGPWKARTLGCSGGTVIEMVQGVRLQDGT